MTYRLPLAVLALAVTTSGGLRRPCPALRKVGGRELDRKPHADD